MRTHVPDGVVADWTMPPPLRKATRAFAEALFSDEASPPPNDRLEWALEDLENFLALSGGRARAVFQASMLAVTTLAPLTIRRAGPLWRLSIPHRIEAIEQFERTPLGLAVFGAKAMLCIVYYEHPDSAAEIGFTGGSKK